LWNQKQTDEARAYARQALEQEVTPDNLHVMVDMLIGPHGESVFIDTIHPANLQRLSSPQSPDGATTRVPASRPSPSQPSSRSLNGLRFFQRQARNRAGSDNDRTPEGIVAAGWAARATSMRRPCHGWFCESPGNAGIRPQDQGGRVLAHGLLLIGS
jgi:hypothetical protein